jgi:hypothetical protein
LAKSGLFRNYGKCAWCGVDIILPLYVAGDKKVSWKAAHAYQNCGENTGNIFHDDCKKDYTKWLKLQPWRNIG